MMVVVLKRFGVFGFCLAAVLLSLTAYTQAAAGTGTVQGHLVNGTKGGSSVANQEVTLKAQVNRTDLPPVTTVTDTNGFFSFSGLATTPEYSYVVTVLFQKAEYLSDQLTFGQGETNKSMLLPVYDSTDSDSALTIATAHTVIYTDKDGADVREYILFSNNGDRTYIAGSNAQTLRFWMTPGATALKLTSGLEPSLVHTTPEGFADVMGVYPGQTDVTYAYRMKLVNGELAYTRKNLYPTDRYDFLFQGAGVKATSARLAKDQALDIRGTIMEHYSATNLTAGETLDIKLSGLSQTAGMAGLLIWMGIGLGVVVAILAVAWFRRKPQPVGVGGNLEPRRKQLLLDLASLDNDFEAGQIAEEPYKRLRSRMKSDLVTLMQAKSRGTGKRARR